MNAKGRIALIASATSVLGLACWFIMFLAGTDVWHDVGSPDFWKLSGPPYADVRIFAWSFYAQFIVLLVGLVMAGRTAWEAPSSRSGHTTSR